NDDLMFTSDSKQDILYALIKTFKKVSDSSIVKNGVKRKAKKIFDSIEDTFERREIGEFFEQLDHEFDITLDIQEQRSNKKRKIEENAEVVNISEKRDSPYDEGVSGDEERKQTKQTRFQLQPPKKKTSPGKRGDTLPDGTRLEKATPLNLLPSDDEDDNDDFSQDDDDYSSHDYNSDEEDVPAPEEALDSVLDNKKPWTLPSGKDFNDIVAKNMSANAKATKRKKRLSAVEKAILRYGASQIIDLSAQMRKWFSIEDRDFIMKDYEALLQVSEMPDEECSFVKIVEDMVLKGQIDEAYKLCTEKHLSSEKSSYIYKITKIYADFIYKSKDQADILDYNAKNTHTEIDVILKTCAYIVEGLNKNYQIYSKWGESFCSLSRSVDHLKGRKCDVRFLSMSGIDVGEWEFSAYTTASKAISDRCRSARINQSILNGLLEYQLNDEQAKAIQVPFLQFSGTSGQMLVENLVEGFYLVFPGPKFELPTNLQSIKKLKMSMNVIKSVLEMYNKTCEIIINLETMHHAFDDIFDDLDTSKPTAHFKSKQIQTCYQDNHLKRCINGDIISNEHARRKEILQSIDERESTIW
ncbi:16728_t:CDS:2, partial [Rhizophagus irregularis]